MKWTLASGLVPLANDYPGNLSPAFVTPRVISADGLVIGGSAKNSAFTSNARTPALWTASGNVLTRLGDFGGSGNPNVGVNSLSADGSVAYGFTRAASQPIAAFRYTPAGGLVNLGYLRPTDTTNFTSLHAASADGMVVVGNSGINTPLPGSGMLAYRYVYTGVGPTGGVMSELPALPGGTWTYVFTMTPDGTQMIGVSDSPTMPGGELVRWYANGEYESLGAPPGYPGFGNFGGVTADGENIVVSTTAGVYIRNPSGWFHLQELLEASGVDLTGWEINSVLGMSSDGRLIYGVSPHDGNPEGYVVKFPVDYIRAHGDVTAPEITSLSVTPSVLRPPNHKMVDVAVSVTAFDAVSAVTAQIVAITSSEPDNGLGDGDTANDVVITGPLTAKLRAERSGWGGGRVYSLTIAVSDASGNTNTGLVTVTVSK